MIKSSWAILLCKFNDDDSEPFPRNYYKDLFTSSGNGSQNMVDFFRDVSHGTLDLGDTQIFGWYTLNKSRSDYGLTGAEKLKNRPNLINWGASGCRGQRRYPLIICQLCGLYERAHRSFWWRNWSGVRQQFHGSQSLRAGDGAFLRACPFARRPAATVRRRFRFGL